MLPIQIGAISGVTNELQDRSNYQDAVQEIRAGGELRVNPVSRTATNNLADNVKRNTIDPDGREGGSGNGPVPYDAVALEVQEEELVRQEKAEQELKSRAEEIKNSPLLKIDVTTPSVIVPKGRVHQGIAKLFIQAASQNRSSYASPILGNHSLKKVDVTV
jgi:hypothetical protein